jgi:hypothetical protein
MSEVTATADNPITVSDPETGMFVTGFNGQTEAQLRAYLAYRKDQLSIVPLRRNK